jgi:hypothetical protein
MTDLDSFWDELEELMEAIDDGDWAVFCPVGLGVVTAIKLFGRQYRSRFSAP